MMPPQTDKLSILRAVLAQLAGRGAIPTDAFGQTALGGQSAPNMSNQFGQAALGGSNSPSSMVAPSGFDATMRGVRLPQEPGFDVTARSPKYPPALLSRTDPYYRSVQSQVTAGDNFTPLPGDITTTGEPIAKYVPPGGVAYSQEDLFGRTATGGTNVNGDGISDKPIKGKSSPKGSVKTISNKMESDMVIAPTRQTNPDVMGFDAALRGEGASDRARPAQSSGKPASKTSTQASGKPTPSGSQTTPQQGKPSESGKSAPVGKAEPSGEALSYFRKNKQSGGWNALGTGVSLVQQSMKPEKGGLKSRTEYDRLLRGSDNFKKLDGNEQQRVRQAFAQWMNEQTIFKGKA